MPDHHQHFSDDYAAVRSRRRTKPVDEGEGQAKSRSRAIESGEEKGPPKNESTCRRGGRWLFFQTKKSWIAFIVGWLLVTVVLRFFIVAIDQKKTTQMQSRDGSSATAGTITMNKQQHQHQERSYQRPVRIWMGIFTRDDPVEAQRRDVIRQTYLSYYKETKTPNYICSWADYQRVASTTTLSVRPRAENDQQLLEDCVLIYSFVFGKAPPSDDDSRIQNKTTTTTADKAIRFDLVKAYHQGDVGLDDLIVPIHGKGAGQEDTNHYHLRFPSAMEQIQWPQDSSERLIDNDCDDRIVLNLRENMNAGKSQSWFLVAISQWHRLWSTNRERRSQPDDLSHLQDDVNDTNTLDYILKIDSDTMLFPEVIVEQLLLPTATTADVPDPEETIFLLPRHPENQNMAGSRDSTTRLPGMYYLNGACYWISWTLAQRLTTNLFRSSSPLPHSHVDLMETAHDANTQPSEHETGADSAAVHFLKHWEVGNEDRTIGNYLWHLPPLGAEEGRGISRNGAMDNEYYMPIRPIPFAKLLELQQQASSREHHPRSSTAGVWMRHPLKHPETFESVWNERYYQNPAKRR